MKIARQKTIKQEIAELCIEALEHACDCKKDNCDFDYCNKMKRITRHAEGCQQRDTGNCSPCMELMQLVKEKAKTCKKVMCNVVFCEEIKKQHDLNETESQESRDVKQENREKIQQEDGNQLAVQQPFYRPAITEEMKYSYQMGAQMAELRNRFSLAQTPEDMEQLLSEVKPNAYLFSAIHKMSFYEEGKSKPQPPFMRDPWVIQRAEIEESHSSYNMMQQMDRFEYRLRQTKAPEKKCHLFNELKRKPYLFRTFMKMCRGQESRFPETVEKFTKYCNWFQKEPKLGVQKEAQTGSERPLEEIQSHHNVMKHK